MTLMEHRILMNLGPDFIEIVQKSNRPSSLYYLVGSVTKNEMKKWGKIQDVIKAFKNLKTFGYVKDCFFRPKEPIIVYDQDKVINYFKEQMQGK